MPGRVFFNGRVWPEGYVFPACVACNRVTADDEQLLALFSLMGDELDDENARNFERLFRSVRAIHPEFIDAIRIPQGANEVRQALRRIGLSKPSNVLAADIPVVTLGPEVHRSVLGYGRKLMLALWYMHTGCILPAKGGVKLKWFTNATTDQQSEAIHDALRLMPSLGELKRSAHQLEDQFAYRFGVADDKNAAAFFLTFRGTFALLGVVSTEADAMDGLNGDVVGPYKW